MSATFQFKTKPYEHQRVVFDLTKDKPAWGLFLEQRLGKSKLVIDTASYLYMAGKIDRVVIIAPNGVHRAWVYGDAKAGDNPKGHFGDHSPIDFVSSYWRSSGTKALQKSFRALVEPSGPRRLRVLAMNIEAIARRNRMPNNALKLLESFLGHTPEKVLFVIDESTCIKNHTGKRAEEVIITGQKAGYKRILSGEPAPEGPQDLYGQLLFLQDYPLGFRSYYAYRARFCVLEQKQFFAKGTKSKTYKKKIKSIVGFKHLEELKIKLASVSTTLKRKDCGDMPDQIYSTRYVELSEQAKKAYTTLAQSWFYELAGDIESGVKEVEVTRALTRIIRFRQITGGFLSDEKGNSTAFTEQPKAEALIDEIKQLEPDSKVIVWAVFRAELAYLYQRLKEAFGNEAVVRYYGDSQAEERDAAKGGFQNDPACKIFLANPKVGRYNLTLSKANNVIWYSWNYNLEDYIQANDRPVLPGKKKAINYTHLLVPNTFESVVLGALKKKQTVADSIRTPLKIQEILNNLN